MAGQKAGGGGGGEVGMGGGNVNVYREMIA